MFPIEGYDTQGQPKKEHAYDRYQIGNLKESEPRLRPEMRTLKERSGHNPLRQRCHVEALHHNHS